MQRFRVVPTDEENGETQELTAQQMSEPSQTISFFDARGDVLLQVVTGDVDRVEILDGHGDAESLAFESDGARARRESAEAAAAAKNTKAPKGV